MIDFGSTAFRACLGELDTIEYWAVRRTTFDDDLDFPNACCPFKEPPVYGQEALSRSGRVPALALAYLLAGADDEILECYPRSEELKARRTDLPFLKTCREMITKLICSMKKRIDIVCDQRRLGYSEVLLILPRAAKAFEEQFTSVRRRRPMLLVLLTPRKLVSEGLGGVTRAYHVCYA